MLLLHQVIDEFKHSLALKYKEQYRCPSEWLRLSSANIVFAWAAKQKCIRANPFAGVKIDVPRTVILRGTKVFKSEEIQWSRGSSRWGRSVVL